MVAPFVLFMVVYSNLYTISLQLIRFLIQLFVITHCTYFSPQTYVVLYVVIRYHAFQLISALNSTHVVAYF